MAGSFRFPRSQALADSATVAVTSASGDRAKRVAAELPRAVGLPLDVRDPASVRNAIERLWADLGSIDMVVNNAGLGMRTVNPQFLTEPRGFWTVSPEGFRDVIDVEPSYTCGDPTTGTCCEPNYTGCGSRCCEPGQNCTNPVTGTCS